MPLTIALDGPVGAGKSTVADETAKRLSILHLDTGAMYRAVGLWALKQGIDLADEEGVTAMAERLRLSVRYAEGKQHTLVEGEDVTGGIRTPEVSMAASTVARYQGVRKAMVALQQKLADEQPMLVDGRDIGFRVLPNATLKVFLTATAEERARRRYLELQKKGLPDTYEQVLSELRKRDDQDMHRAVDPLQVAPGARVLDSTHLNMNEVVETLVAWAKEAEQA